MTDCVSKIKDSINNFLRTNNKSYLDYIIENLYNGDCLIILNNNLSRFSTEQKKYYLINYIYLKDQN